MADLMFYEYGRRINDVVGTKMLVDSTTQEFSVSDGTSQTVIGSFDGTDLVSYGYQTDYPLYMKLFCSDVTPDTTMGKFYVTVSGQLGDMTAVRYDTEDFGLIWSVKDWVSKTGVDATVSVRSVSPITSTSMTCVCGIALDAIDRKGEGSYA